MHITMPIYCGALLIVYTLTVSHNISLSSLFLICHLPLETSSVMFHIICSNDDSITIYKSFIGHGTASYLLFISICLPWTFPTYKSYMTHYHLSIEYHWSGLSPLHSSHRRAKHPRQAGNTTLIHQPFAKTFLAVVMLHGCHMISCLQSNLLTEYGLAFHPLGINCHLPVIFCGTF